VSLGAALRRSIVIALTLAGAMNAYADDRTDLANFTCAAIERSVVATPGADPLFVASYRLPDQPPGDMAASRDVAYTYDNALAAIALFACGKPAAARRIADALVLATTNDPEFHDGRVRNAYAAGPIKDGLVKTAGHWSAEQNRWIQDPYQVSFATGNEAWAALALLEAYRRTHQASYLDAARRVLTWVRDHTFDPQQPAGFVGGYFGYASALTRNGYKSTEHNVDLAAAWAQLDRVAPDPDAKAQAKIALAFVASQWNAADGRFFIGTKPDGKTPDPDRSGLDAQLWPLIAVARPPADWMRALAFVDAKHAIAGGYGYPWNPDGIWTEGSAQAAAVFVLRGMPARAKPLWPLLGQQRTDDGWLFATPLPRIRTGLAIGPASKTDDFYYYHLPHLGATAWAALAAMGANPFTGERAR
jgi:hypothetical protein